MSRNNPDDELQSLTAFLPGLDLGAGLRAPDKKAGAGKRPRATITPIERRLIEAAAADQADQSILYQHTVFCQTGMPYRDPGKTFEYGTVPTTMQHCGSPQGLI
ncbi:hypothetical protein BH09PAT4_BH09PAT4_09640 [soil metagenome]